MIILGEINLDFLPHTLKQTPALIGSKSEGLMNEKHMPRKKNKGFFIGLI